MQNKCILNDKTQNIKCIITKYLLASEYVVHNTGEMLRKFFK